MSQFESLKLLVKPFRPKRLDELWDGSRSDVSLHSELYLMSQHLQVEHLDWWCRDEEISELLSNSERCEALVSTFARSLVELGLVTQQELPDRFDRVYYVNCISCNTPYDADGGCNHAGGLPHVALTDIRYERALHNCIVLGSLVTHLLARPYSDSLLRILLNEPPLTSRLSTLEWIVEQSELNHKIQPVPALVGILDNCSFAFPKAAHISAALLSQCVCRNPSSSFLQLAGESLIPAVERYLSHVMGLVQNSNCIVEEHYGVVAFLNICPLLYHLANWRVLRPILVEKELATVIMTVAINICHSATLSNGEMSDCAPDLDNLPELLGAQMLIEPLLSFNENASAVSSWRSEVLRTRPMSYAYGAALEIMGRWAYKSLKVWNTVMPTTTTPETLASTLEEYQPNLDVLVTRTPQLSVVLPIVQDLIHKKKPASLPPYRTSLLREPLHKALSRCALPSCGATEGPGSDVRLEACTGGCAGLAVYCSREHQQQHWPRHKEFCKEGEKTKKGGNNKKKNKGKKKK